MFIFVKYDNTRLMTSKSTYTTPECHQEYISLEMCILSTGGATGDDLTITDIDDLWGSMFVI